MESVCQHLYQLTEVHTLVGYVVEDGLVAVSLILHVAYLHIELQVLGYLAALYHRGLLTRLGLIVALHVAVFGKAVKALDVVSRLEVGFLQLQRHQAASKRNHTYIVSRTGLYSHPVAFLQRQTVDVTVIALTGVLELHLYQVCALGIAGHIGQPVVGVKLVVAARHALGTQSARTRGCERELHIRPRRLLLCRRLLSLIL